MPTFIGLDISARQAHFAITSDGTVFQSGTITLRQLPQLIETHQIGAVACEYTGRLGDQWSLSAEDSGATAFFIHTVERRAMNRLAGATVKTDKRDAQTIAHMLYLHADLERRQLLSLADHLFTDAATVRNAWQLRAMCASVDQLTAQRTAAMQRVEAAAKSGMVAVAEQWQEIAKSKAPDLAAAAAEKFAAGVFPNELALLQSIPQVGQRVSTYLLAQLMPVERFESGRKVKAYAGLYPRVAQSGEVVERARMTKKGSPQLRGMLYIATVGQVESDTRVGRHYRQLVERGMSKRKALCAASIKLLSIARAVLASGKPYFDPEAVQKPAQEQKEAMPEHCITQADAARLIGTSRQRVGQLVTSGALRSQPWRKTRILELASVQRYIEHKAAAVESIKKELRNPSGETEFSVADRGAEAAEDPQPQAAKPPKPHPGETGRQREIRLAQARTAQAEAERRMRQGCDGAPVQTGTAADYAGDAEFFRAAKELMFCEL